MDLPILHYMHSLCIFFHFDSIQYYNQNYFVVAMIIFMGFFIRFVIWKLINSALQYFELKATPESDPPQNVSYPDYFPIPSCEIYVINMWHNVRRRKLLEHHFKMNKVNISDFKYKVRSLSGSRWRAQVVQLWLGVPCLRRIIKLFYAV